MPVVSGALVLLLLIGFGVIVSTVYEEGGYVTAEQLKTRRLPEDDVVIEGLGRVRVRGMSRWETTHIQSLEGNRQKQDAEALRLCMVRPVMSEEDVATWRRAGRVMEIETIARKINDLSGIGKGAAKSVVPTDGDEPDPGV